MAAGRQEEPRAAWSLARRACSTEECEWPLCGRRAAVVATGRRPDLGGRRSRRCCRVGVGAEISPRERIIESLFYIADGKCPRAPSHLFLERDEFNQLILSEPLQQKPYRTSKIGPSAQAIAPDGSRPQRRPQSIPSPNPNQSCP